jgi:hypothetical protein
MKSHSYPRTWQVALAFCALLIASLTPLGNTAASSAASTPAAGVGTGSITLSALPSAAAAFPLPASAQFDILGFLDQATLDPSCAANPRCGGSLQVNGLTVMVPKETIVIFPANALTWQELFAQAPAPYGLGVTPPASGLALADTPKPITTYEVHAIGNRVADTYIAGLIYIAQQSLNGGAGYINYMDYGAGEMRVGGAIGDPNSGARVQINDPATVPDGRGGLTGRFGKGLTPDKRFTVDQDNPTITAATGFPMCFPRTDPAVADDPLCPQGNRPITTPGSPPVYASTIQTRNPYAEAGIFPDATKQAPFEVGDYITYAGTRFVDSKGMYISAHTITNNVTIFTWPGTNPAYVLPDVTIMGTGGLTIFGAAESAARSRVEGMTTDPTRFVRIFGVDFDPATGATTDRDWGLAAVDQGPPTGAVRGRWRFRPRASFVPATREIRVAIGGAWFPGQTTTYANGIIAGQYHAPVLEYLFPENIPGTPIVANNFETLDFLRKGGYVSSAGTVAGTLNPWPGATAPAPDCIQPIADTGGPYTVTAQGTIALAGNATGSAPIAYQWTPSAGAVSDPSIANPTYTASAAVQTVPLSLTASNSCGTSTASTTIDVSAPTTPTVNSIAPQTVVSGQTGVTLAATGSPGAIFTWQQTGGTIVLAPNPATGATVTFTAPALPAGQVTPMVLTFQVTAKNSAGLSSAPVSTTVTVKPVPDSISVTVAEYRFTKSRLTISAISTAANPNVVLTLQPYMTTAGTMFDPSRLGNTFTSPNVGVYNLILVGAPEPAEPPDTPLMITSNIGGSSAPTGLLSIRP